jgi:hypothetical protein
MNHRFLIAATAACTANVGTGTAHVRVAHLSPDAPNVDFCLAAHGSNAFTKPTLASNGHLTGLPYGHATKYFDVPAAQYDVRLVPPGGSDCAHSLGGLPDFAMLPQLADGVTATIAAEGLVAFGATTPLDLRAYVDDTDVPAGQTKLRFVHASPNAPAVDIGIGGGALFTSVFSDISYGQAASVANGYVTTAPIDGAEISARAHGSLDDALSIKPAALPAGALATAFAIGLVGDATTPLRVLLCIDNAAPTGLLSSCAVVGGTPERARVRFAHLSPDTPAVDICLAPTGTGAFTAPLLKTLGNDNGLAYAQLTAYVPLPVGAYDARIVHATASGCSIGAVPDAKNVAIGGGLVATVAAIGDLTRAGSDPGLGLAVFVDDVAVTAGNTKLRFVHASPGTPPVDVGLGSGASFVKVFADVAFGAVATRAPVDTFGYAETSPTTTAVAARLANSSTDALVVPSVMLPAGQIATAFAIGNKTGMTTNPLRVLLCADNAMPSGLATPCTVAP